VPCSNIVGFSGTKKQKARTLSLTSKKHCGLAKPLERPSWCAGLAAAPGIPARLPGLCQPDHPCLSTSPWAFASWCIRAEEKMPLSVICDGSPPRSTFPDEYSG